MKRFIGSLVMLSAMSAVFAQAPFTIVRPADNSKVREKVHVLFPLNSVPDKGYIGIFLNGKFTEAIAPDSNGKYLDYTLDTKAREIADGPLKIEAVLYVDYGDKPKVVDRSSIQVTVGNQANIDIPENGIALRYNWKPGQQYIYDLTQRIGTATITEAQAKLGGHMAELPLDSESIRLLYSVENAYGNGDGLLRIQGLTPKGKDYVMLTTDRDGEQKKYYDYMMASIYMRVQNTGMEVFGSMPRYFPMEGSAGGYDTDLIAAFPLPVFPTKRVKPGDTWGGRFLLPDFDLTKIDEMKSIAQNVPARGDFVGVEWESGHPCAKIRHSFDVGMASGSGFFQKMTGVNSQKFEELMWFALDKHVVLKLERNYVIDRKDVIPASGGGGIPGGANPDGGITPGGTGGTIGKGPRGGTAGKPGGKRGNGGGDFAQGKRPMGGGPGAQPGPPGVAGSGGQGVRPGRGQGNSGGGNTGGGTVITRFSVQQVFTLEQ